MNRAYSIITIKSVDAERRLITGMATTPTPDRMGDIVEPLGVQFKNPLPLLLYHDSKQPVGTVTFKKPTKDGIAFEASIPIIADPPSLKDRVDTAWSSVKAGLLKGVSIGFRSIEEAFNKDTMGLRFLKTEVLELSLVAVPANADATIASIKSFDLHAPAASGTGRAIHTTPGVSGSRRDRSMTNSEQLTEQKALLQTKHARLAELEAADDTNGGLDAEETNERETLTKEVPALTAKVSRLAMLEAAQAGLAGTIGYEPAGQQKAPALRTSIRQPNAEKKDYPAWLPFIRATMAKAVGRGSFSDTMAYAKRWERETPEVIAYLKAVPGSTVDSLGSPGSPPAWGSQLVPLETGRAFVDQLMPATIIGRLNLVPTPFLTRIVVQTGGSTVEWVGQKGKKPVSELSFLDFSMPRHKIAGIVTISDELARSSQPDAEETVRRDLNRQIVKFMDRQFIDVSVGAGTNNPASITNSVTPISATGTDVNAMLADFNTALATFDSSDLGTDGLAIVTSPAVARGLSMMLSTLGNRQFPEMTPTGGSVLGYTVIVSNNVPSGDIVFIKQDQVRISSDRQIMIDVSNQATLDMGDGNTTFNLWQNNCVGLRAESYVTWLKDRDEAVAVISGAAYGPTVGSV